MKSFFRRRISLTKIYDMIKKRNLPHVNADGKILLDVNLTIQWWNNSLKKSVEPPKFTGLKKII